MTSTPDNPMLANKTAEAVQAATLRAIAAALAGMRFGQVTVTVHDGHVVQIDRTERLRLSPPAEITADD